MGDTSFSAVSVNSKWRKKRGKKAVEEYDSEINIELVLYLQQWVNAGSVTGNNNGNYKSL